MSSSATGSPATPSSEPDISRREFIRALAGATAVVTAAGAALPAAGDAVTSGVPASFGTAPLAPVATESDWLALRRQFLLEPDVVYFNTGSLGACPRSVVEAHSRYLREIERNPASLLYGAMGEEMEQVRARAAGYFGVSTDEMMLTANTTTGMNLVAGALSLQAGDEVLTTNQEHPGGRVCWEHEQARRGIVLREFDLSKADTDEATLLATVRAALTDRTKVISVSHVSTITGLRMPLTALSRLARERGIFLVVDGAQSAGMLDINLSETGCDAFATSGHKWMLGPKGSGLLYLRKEFQKQLSSVYLRGGLRAYTAASGTRNVPQILAQGQALAFLEQVGRRRIVERTLALARHLRDRLAPVQGVEVVSPATAHLQSAIMTLKLSSDKPEHTGARVGQRLWERYRIVVKAVPGEYFQGRAIRISTHFYNTKEEVEQLAGALDEILTAG